MKNKSSYRLLLALLPAWALVSTAFADNTLYIGIYNQNQILRYDSSGNAISPTPWAGSGSTASPTSIKGEGIACGMGYSTVETTQESVNNPVYIANAGAGTIEIANADAASGVNPIVNSSFISGLTGVANIALSNNGQDLYVAQESGNKVSEYNALTGTLITSLAFTGAHDVILDSSGNVYVTAYGASQPSSLGVVRIDAQLDASSETSFIATGNNGLNHATGMVFDSNKNLWVANVNSPIGTTASANNFVSEYTSTGTFVRTIASSGNNLLTVFGLSLGGDGNIYASSFEGQEITKINTTTDTASTFITLPSGDNPKYATWESDCVTYSAVPEPRTYAVMLLGAGLMLLVVRRLKRSRLYL